jgi:Glyoxalase-like domain
MTGILDIDHLMLGVADPDAAAADFARLGFATTPLSSMSQVGLANRCVMLNSAVPGASNYLELLGHDPQRAAPFMAALLGGGEGIKSLVLAADDMKQSMARLAACGAPTGAPLHIERRWTLPDGEVLDLAFTVATPALDAPPVYCNLCRHHTLHHYLRPEWRQHQNGARSLVAVLVEADEPERVTAWYARLFDRPPAVAIEARRVAGAKPRAIGLAVSVADMAAVATLLTRNGVSFTRTAAALAVSLRGIRIEFRPAN